MEIVRIGKSSPELCEFTGNYLMHNSVSAGFAYDVALMRYKYDTMIEGIGIAGKISGWVDESIKYVQISQQDNRSRADGNEDLDEVIQLQSTFEVRYQMAGDHQQLAYDFGRTIALEGHSSASLDQCLTLYDLAVRSYVGIFRMGLKPNPRLRDGFFMDVEVYDEYSQKDCHFTSMIDNIPGTLYIVT